MHPIFRCLLYVAAIGLLSNPIAYFLPRRWFHPDRFPFRAFRWEKNGAVYEKIGIRRWKDKVIDQSRITSFLVKKTVTPRMTARQAQQLVIETCVSEAVHLALALLSLYCLRLWPGLGGVIFTALFIVFGQLMYAVIQRYNRPRLADVAKRLQKREQRIKEKELTE